MAWNTTGWNRTLKLKITKTEKTGYYDPEEIIIDGNVTDFTGTTPYTWTTGGNTMSRADITEFNQRTGATYNFVLEKFPDLIDDIDFSKFRTLVGLLITGNYTPDGTQMIFSVTQNGAPFYADNTIRIPVEWEIYSYTGITYFYIFKDDNSTPPIDLDNNYYDYLNYGSFTINEDNIKNVSEYYTGINKTQTPNGNEIVPQTNVYFPVLFQEITPV